MTTYKSFCLTPGIYFILAQFILFGSVLFQAKNINSAFAFLYIYTV